MERNVNLLSGSILKALTSLAIPIMLTSLIQMAYNLTDMIWIGELGSNAVAAVGAAGLFMWLGNGFVTTSKMGGQIKVGHNLGANDLEQTRKYARSSYQLTLFFALFFSAFCLIFKDNLIGFFNLNNISTINDATNYLTITSGLVVFSFLNYYYTGILTAMGNSKLCFKVNTIGLIINIILDPILIRGFIFIPSLGVKGAALATVLAQFIVFLLFLKATINDQVIFKHLKLFTCIDFKAIKEIVIIGLPVALESMIFSIISMFIARFVSVYGDASVAVQKVGSQIESISWMISEGFASALNSFIAQNYGANNEERIKKGFKVAISIMLVWGIFTTILLFFFAKPIFMIFIKEIDVIPLGVDYLQILALSQLFMCVEITCAACFNGVGKTTPPFIVSFILTGARIPLALILSNLIGLNGIWWTITISSLFKGIVIFIWLMISVRKTDFLTNNIVHSD